MICKSCGGTMHGDGLKEPFVCENIDYDHFSKRYPLEPDANPLYCTDNKTTKTMIGVAFACGFESEHIEVAYNDLMRHYDVHFSIANLVYEETLFISEMLALGLLERTDNGKLMFKDISIKEAAETFFPNINFYE